MLNVVSDILGLKAQSIALNGGIFLRLYDGPEALLHVLDEVLLGTYEKKHCGVPLIGIVFKGASHCSFLITIGVSISISPLR